MMLSSDWLECSAKDVFRPSCRSLEQYIPSPHRPVQPFYRKMMIMVPSCPFDCRSAASSYWLDVAYLEGKAGNGNGTEYVVDG